MSAALAPGPTWTIDYVSRRVIIRLALSEIVVLRSHHDFSPLRRTPASWFPRSVETERRSAANRIREALAVLRAVGWKERTPGRRGWPRGARKP